MDTESYISQMKGKSEVLDCVLKALAAITDRSVYNKRGDMSRSTTVTSKHRQPPLKRFDIAELN
jgi:hypothetical protein